MKVKPSLAGKGTNDREDEPPYLHFPLTDLRLIKLDSVVISDVQHRYQDANAYCRIWNFALDQLSSTGLAMNAEVHLDDVLRLSRFWLSSS